MKKETIVQKIYSTMDDGVDLKGENSLHVFKWIILVSVC